MVMEALNVKMFSAFLFLAIVYANANANANANKSRYIKMLS